VRHAHRARDLDRAAALIWAASPLYIANGRTATVSRWLELFTLEEIAARPPLALAAAWCAVTAPQTQPILHWTELARRGGADDRLPDGTPLAAAVALLDAVAGDRGLSAMAADASCAYGLDADDSPFRAIACYLEGTARRLLGETDAARERLQEGVRRGALVPPTVSACLAALALLAIDADDWAEAEACVHRGKELVTARNLRERPAQALLFAVSTLVQAHRGAPEARADALHTRHLLAMLNHISPWIAIEARLVLARAELLLGDIEIARLLVREAGDLVARFPDAGRLAETLGELTETLSGAGTTAGVAVPLTTAELRVLRYLPTHLSFQAMADELFVSRNTVKTQAIAIYRKLGVSSRGDAVARAVELGILDG
jgi:LuxR family maltose regulon positive regulatory protein